MLSDGRVLFDIINFSWDDPKCQLKDLLLNLGKIHI